MQINLICIIALHHGIAIMVFSFSYVLFLPLSDYANEVICIREHGVHGINTAGLFQLAYLTLQGELEKPCNVKDT